MSTNEHRGRVINALFPHNVSEKSILVGALAELMQAESGELNWPKLLKLSSDARDFEEVARITDAIVSGAPHIDHEWVTAILKVYQSSFGETSEVLPEVNILRNTKLDVGFLLGLFRGRHSIDMFLEKNAYRREVRYSQFMLDFPDNIVAILRCGVGLLGQKKETRLLGDAVKCYVAGNSDADPIQRVFELHSILKGLGDMTGTITPMTSVVITNLCYGAFKIMPADMLVTATCAALQPLKETHNGEIARRLVAGRRG